MFWLRRNAGWPSSTCKCSRFTVGGTTGEGEGDERRPFQHGYPQILKNRRRDLATRDRDRGAGRARPRQARRKHAAQAARHPVDPGTRARARRRRRDRALLESPTRPGAFRYFAAVTMISTNSSGRARSAFTQARAGGFSGSTQAFHTEFMSAKSAMSLIHKLAARRFDLLVPACAR